MYLIPLGERDVMHDVNILRRCFVKLLLFPLLLLFPDVEVVVLLFELDI